MALKFFDETQDKKNALEEKIAKLEDNTHTLTSLEKRLENVEVKLNTSAEKSIQTPEPDQPNAASPTTPTITSKSQPTIPKPAPSLDKKFNVVVYGISKSPTSTSKHERIDLDCLMRVFCELKLSIIHDSMKDFHRLGKFVQSNTHPYPIPVKFLRAFEATLVLSSKRSLSSGIAIKPGMSAEERKIISILLKERHILINSCSVRKLIKICGNVLYVNHKLYTTVQNSKLHLLSLNP